MQIEPSPSKIRHPSTSVTTTSKPIQTLVEVSDDGGNDGGGYLPNSIVSDRGGSEEDYRLQFSDTDEWIGQNVDIAA